MCSAAMCRICVCMSARGSLHIAAFPYSPGVRRGLLSSNRTYRPLFPLSATCPLMSGKSFTFFLCGSTFHQLHTQKHVSTYTQACASTNTRRKEAGMRGAKGGITKDQEGSEVQVNTCSVSKRRAKFELKQTGEQHISRMVGVFI